MEILQRRTSCGPGNAKGTQESFWHCRPILPHIPSSTQQPEMEQGQYSQPFIPCHFFSVSGIQCSDYIYVGAAQSWPMLINSFVWSPDFACTVAIRTIYTHLALALTVWAFICLLPLPLHKAPLSPPCFGTQFNTEDSCSACPTNRAAMLQEHSTPIHLLILPPHHRASLSLCRFYVFPPFTMCPWLKGGFHAPFSTSLPLSCGKAKELPWSQVCCRKISLLIYYMNIFLSPTLHRFLKTFYSRVVTLHS